MIDQSSTALSKNSHATRGAFSPSLAQIVTVALISLALMLAFVTVIFYWSARNALLESSNQFREKLRQNFDRHVDDYFGRAERPLGEIAQLVKSGVLPTDDAEALERELFLRLSGEPALIEIKFILGSPSDPKAVITVRRNRNGTAPSISSRLTVRSGAAFITKSRQWQPSTTDPRKIPWDLEPKGNDPTQGGDATATSQFSKAGTYLWSDIGYYHEDVALPAEQRRVTCTTKRTIENSDRKVTGVIQASLSVDNINEIVQLNLADEGKTDPHILFVSDTSGRVVTGTTPQSPFQEIDGVLRAHNNYPPHVSEILRLIAAGDLPEGQSLTRTINGRRYILGYKQVDRINKWVACIVVPEESSLGGVVTLLKSALIGTIVIFIVIFVLSVIVLRLIRSNLNQLTAQSIAMREFDFTRSSISPTIRDMRDVMESMEQAKTSMRSMSKYVPVTLVRQLHQMHAEPTLGSVLTDTTILFTDIKNFTTMAERLSPNDLAIVLGRYLETMSNEIQSYHGTIDKFIGDAVMAIWNAPLPVPNHSVEACNAAWACTQALMKLFSSKEWGNYPRLETGFGIHRSDAMIGHFGAPTRFSYTAIGDGVNFASRLEGLNRLFGTTILVSETVYNEAKNDYLFRLVEIVAVKGKRNGMHIYELVGPLKDVQSKVESVRTYEEAFALYLRRQFEPAAMLFEKMQGDVPAQLLAARCREMISNPPPMDWDGVHVVKTK